MTDSSKLQASHQPFDISRDYPAGLDRVWDAWSQGDQLGKWWGPPGCVIDVKRLEFRLGGFFHYAMTFAGAPPMYGRFNYRDIVPEQRIVWLNSFANESCGIARAPFSEVCPLEIENTVTFSFVDGITKVSLRAVPFGASAAELDFFANLLSSGSLAQGYGGTFNQLGDHLQAT